MKSLVAGLIVVFTVCGGLNAASEYKDNVLRFESHDPLNNDDKSHYTDCHHLRYTGGYNVSGIYTLYLNKSFSYQVRCEHTPNNSFTVIQRRINGAENFKRGFFDYQNGFGYAQADYWVGLNQIYYLTTAGNNVLHIDMQTWNGHRQSVSYRLFRILDTSSYTLEIGGYRGAVTDDLGFNNGMPFSTFDRPDVNHCASNILAGWWYNYCTYALPNGVYYYGGAYTPPAAFYDGIYWKDWTGYGYSLKFFTMSVSHA